MLWKIHNRIQRTLYYVGHILIINIRYFSSVSPLYSCIGVALRVSVHVDLCGLFFLFALSIDAEWHQSGGQGHPGAEELNDTVGEQRFDKSSRNGEGIREDKSKCKRKSRDWNETSKMAGWRKVSLDKALDKWALRLWNQSNKKVTTLFYSCCRTAAHYLAIISFYIKTQTTDKWESF